MGKENRRSNDNTETARKDHSAMVSFHFVSKCETIDKKKKKDAWGVFETPAVAFDDFYGSFCCQGKFEKRLAILSKKEINFWSAEGPRASLVPRVISHTLACLLS